MSGDITRTSVPMFNVALSDKIEGGLIAGVTVLAGESKKFKSGFALFLASEYLKKYEDSVLLFYDSEFGTPKSYWEMFDIFGMNKAIHSPITDIEMLKHDCMVQLKQWKRDDRLIVVVDSLGGLASVKEIEDTIAGKQVADMTRAKSIKSFFRMATPLVNLLNIPMILINHVYKDQSGGNPKYAKNIVSGGTGPYLSADTIFLIGRQQEKEGDEITGFNFILTIEKSRFVREKAKIPINVTYDGGIKKWTGLFDIARELDWIKMPKSGWYQLKDHVHDANFRRADVEYDESFWTKMLSNKHFVDDVEAHFKGKKTLVIVDDEVKREESSFDE